MTTHEESHKNPQFPQIAVVMQATAQHPHACTWGIVNALTRLGNLKRVFRPQAAWGQEEPTFDDGLYDYLAHPDCQYILFLGFDWHSQPLHTTSRWRTRIRESSCMKIGYFHETFLNTTPEELHAKTHALKNASAVLDVIWHSCPEEKHFIDSTLGGTIPITTSGFPGFAVDTQFFKCSQPQSLRPGFAVFRGKWRPFFVISQYQERRELLEHLFRLQLVEVNEYNPGGFDDNELVKEYNKYRIVIDPPSVYAGPTTRVFEGLACGCIVFSHERNYTTAQVEELAPLLRTFSSKEDLAAKLRSLQVDPAIDFSEEQLCKVSKRVGLDTQLKWLVEMWTKRGGWRWKPGQLPSKLFFVDRDLAQAAAVGKLPCDAASYFMACYRS